ncbi:MAG: type II secretion system protein [Eubacterium sp.]|nr:type II secretion system protein [Eubacterium sp.]
MKKRNDKGFTLVELIVVLVILAILAAILVPALLGYIDKAREKQVTTNAEAAYVAAQATATEYYGKDITTLPTDDQYKDKISKLTDITEDFSVQVAYKGESGHDKYIISAFVYKSENNRYAVWLLNPGTVDGEDIPAGGWKVIEAEKSITLGATTLSGSQTLTSQ